MLTRLASLTLLVGVVGACGDDDSNTPIDAPVTDDAAADAPGSDATPDGTTPSSGLIAYVGGYNNSISWFDVDPGTGALTARDSLAAFSFGPSFFATHGEYLYAVAFSSDVGAYRIDQTTGALTFLNQSDVAGSNGTHIAVTSSGDFVLTANYGDGTVAVIPTNADGSVDAPLQTLDLGDNAHQIVLDPTEQYALVPCLGSDYVAQLTFNKTTGALAPNAVPQFMTADGAGPRHLAFAPDGTHVYLLNELASTLSVLAFDPATGQLSEIETVSSRATGATGTSTGAEVLVSADGQFVYASNRGDDTIATFSIAAATGRVTQVAQTPAGGESPRHFTIDATGEWMYVANQDTSSIVPLRIDATTGIPAAAGAPITGQAAASFVGLVSLP